MECYDVYQTYGDSNDELIKILSEMPEGSEQMDKLREQIKKEDEEAEKNKCIIS
ncbi:MAG: hypothetical protein Barrevirus1_66 [Barrevirus sp.]|uniref:Uncharacterized protein n=1 Tax=Barrevirus sp. TaxID=2487763 RepID=A0A3G4ZR77_9VIRU|nr:MAG: hypothetical protein Barrevirus1_66 [Barrevirus sp.]